MGLPRYIATGLGIGYAPFAPGTCASFAALGIGFACVYAGGFWLLLCVFFALLLAGFWTSALYLREHKEADPSEVVIDEICGQLLVLLVLERFWPDYLLAFLLFRFFDIVKPWPVSFVERRYGGSAGVMGDDLVAGLLAALCLWAGFYWWR